MKRGVEADIKEWFKDHKATYTEHGDLKVLDWKKPGTNFYYIRFVFDGCKMYVSGDLGEAVFWFTERADVHIQSRYGLSYFEEKLRAYHESRRDFNSDKAVKRLREWLKEIKEDGTKYDCDDMRKFFEDARGCSSHSEWVEVIHGHDDLISKLDQDCYEWLFGIGDEVPIRMRSYLIGLKLAAEQLRAECAQ